MTTFMHLPGEIRNIIYRFAQPRIWVDIADSQRNQPVFLKNITPAIDREYRSYFYGDAIFMLNINSMLPAVRGARMTSYERLRSIWTQWYRNIPEDAHPVSHIVVLLVDVTIKIDISWNGDIALSMKWRSVPNRRQAYDEPDWMFPPGPVECDISRRARICRTIDATVSELNGIAEPRCAMSNLEALMAVVLDEMEARDQALRRANATGLLWHGC